MDRRHFTFLPVHMFDDDCSARDEATRACQCRRMRAKARHWKMQAATNCAETRVRRQEADTYTRSYKVGGNQPDESAGRPLGTSGDRQGALSEEGDRGVRKMDTHRRDQRNRTQRRQNKAVGPKRDKIPKRVPVLRSERGFRPSHSSLLTASPNLRARLNCPAPGGRGLATYTSHPFTIQLWALAKPGRVTPKRSKNSIRGPERKMANTKTP